MTEQEALALKPGDRVEARYGSKWHVVEVDEVLFCTQRYVDVLASIGMQSVSQVGEFMFVRVRKTGSTSAGKRFTAVPRHPPELRPCGAGATPQVFSDWLEERGYYEAAQALRKAFPLATGD